jgi:hypothetical protein
MTLFPPLFASMIAMGQHRDRFILKWWKNEPIKRTACLNMCSIQQGYVPEGYSESQMNKLERLTEKWAKDLAKDEN